MSTPSILESATLLRHVVHPPGATHWWTSRIGPRSKRRYYSCRICGQLLDEEPLGYPMSAGVRRSLETHGQAHLDEITRESAL